MSNDSRKHTVTITLQSLSASIGAIVGLIALLVILAPKTPHHLGSNKELVVLCLGAVSVFCLLLLIVRFAKPERPPMPSVIDAFKSTPSAILSAVTLVGVAVSLLLIIWNHPSERQIARQILNNRGMHLTRNDYMTALEIGDEDAIVLFHEAGFSPRTAFIWLGGPAATHPDRLSAHVLLTANDGDQLRSVVRSFAQSATRPTGSLSGVELDLTDTRIVVQIDDSRRRSEILADSAALSRELDNLLTTDGISLLGYAVLWEQRKAVNTLLELGADLRIATAPLLRVGELPSGSELLAVDPFLYVLNDGDGNLVVLNENNRSDRYVQMLRDQGYYPSLFADPKGVLEQGSRGSVCSSPVALVGPSAKYRRFVGFRRTADGYSIAELVVKACVASNDTGQIDASVRFLGIGEDGGPVSDGQMDAVLRVAKWRGERAGTSAATEHYAWMTGASVDRRSADEPWLHYTGSFAKDAGSVEVVREDETIEIVRTDKHELSGDRIAEIVGAIADPDLKTLSCDDTRVVEFYEEQPLHLMCDKSGKVAISRTDSILPYFVAIAKGDGGYRYVIIADGKGHIRTAPGEHWLVVIGLTRGETAKVEASFVEVTPEVRPEDDPSYVARWPGEEVSLMGRFEETLSQYVFLSADMALYGRVDLTGLEADVDVFLQCVEGGEGCADMGQLESTNSDTRDEVIRGIIWPGTYRIGLHPYDREPTGFKVVLSSSDIERLHLDNGSATHVEISPNDEEYFALEVERAARMVVRVVETEGDVTFRVFESQGRLIGMAGIEDSGDDGSMEVEAGVYYVGVYVVRRPGSYRLEVSVEE